MQLQELFFFATTIIIIASSLPSLLTTSFPSPHTLPCILQSHHQSNLFAIALSGGTLSVLASIDIYMAFQATYLWGKVDRYTSCRHMAMDWLMVGWMVGDMPTEEDGIWQQRHVSRLSVREYSLNEATAETSLLHMNPFINWRIWKCPQAIMGWQLGRCDRFSRLRHRVLIIAVFHFLLTSDRPITLPFRRRRQRGN